VEEEQTHQEKGPDFVVLALLQHISHLWSLSWHKSSKTDWKRLCVLPLSLGRTLGQSCWVDHSLGNQPVYLWKCLMSLPFGWLLTLFLL